MTAKPCPWLRGRGGTVHAGCFLDDVQRPFPEEQWSSRWCDDPNGPRCGEMVARLREKADAVVHLEETIEVKGRQMLHYANLWDESQKKVNLLEKFLIVDGVMIHPDVVFIARDIERMLRMEDDETRKELVTEIRNALAFEKQTERDQE